MIKNLLTILLFINSIYNAECQNSIEQIEITNLWNYGSLKKTIESKDSLYFVVFKNDSNNIVLKGQINDLDSQIWNGRFTFFSNEKKPICIGYYKQDIPFGTWSYFGENGSVEKVISYSNVHKYLNEKSNLKLEDNVLMWTDNMPKYKGQSPSYFLNSIQKKAIYPISSALLKNQGLLFVSVVIDKTGNLINPKIVNGIDNAINLEVYRLFSESETWIPGSDKKGNPVNIKLMFPIRFKL